MDKNNNDKIHWKADTYSNIGGLNVYAKEDTKRIINVTNNKAFYYSKLAKKYKDEAKEYSEAAKFYAEQNSNLTQEHLLETRVYLEQKINTKQDAGDYLLAEDLPENVSAFTNDAGYVTETELDDAIDSVKLPEQANNAGKFLQTDGESSQWVEICKDSLFDLKLSDKILSFEESKGWALQGTWVYKNSSANRYGYSDFYAKCLEEKEAGVETQTTLGDSTITTYNNSNGHVFFDIADKSVVDSFYNTYGACWLYGIDEENERVFLPRNNWFEQCSVSNPGQFINAGLPNITGRFGGGLGQGTVNQGAFYPGGDYSGEEASAGGRIDEYVYFDASRCSSVYGKSNTVQPAAVKKLLYICVGNTINESSVTNVTEITTSENDTMPLGFSMYQKGAQPSSAWLASNGQWNDGNLYTTFYNYAVNKIGDAFASGYIKEADEDYNDYDLVINQDEMTFRLPLLDGSEDLLSYSKIDNWTLKPSDGIYTAPANGWIHCVLEVAANGYLGVRENLYQMGGGSSGWIGGLTQVSKGQSFGVYYANYISTVQFRFIYAKGNGTLYFKVANAVQNLELLDAGEVLDSLADKIGHQDCKSYVTETYRNGLSWYRVYSDGWCEQGGSVFGDGGSISYQASFLKPFANNDYTITTSFTSTSTNSSTIHVGALSSRFANGFGMYIPTNATGLSWEAKGYIS